MINQWLSTLKERKFEKSLVEKFAEALRDEVLLPSQADGLRMQVAFVYLTELRNVAGSNLKPELLHEFLSPFLCILIEPPSEVMLTATIKDVFENLLNNNPFENVDYAKIGISIHTIAAEHQTLGSAQRKSLYALARRFSNKQPTSNEEPRKKEKLMKEEKSAVVTPNVSSQKDDTLMELEEKQVPKTQKETKSSKQVEVNKHKNKNEKSAKQTEENNVELADGGKKLNPPEKKRSVRFSHKDIVGIRAITKQMKTTEKKSAATFGMPNKSLLKKKINSTS